MNGNDLKAVIPVHIILGVNNYTKIKTQERPRVRPEGEPVAELTKLGWVVVSPGNSSEVTNLLFSKTSLHDYENLCSLDYLGIEENHVKSDDLIYDKFRKQLGRNSKGYYETNLIWKEGHSLLSGNKYGNIGRLNNLVKNLRRTNKLEVYDSIIQEQRANEIIKKVEVEEENETVSERVFYLPHIPVIRGSAETTKIRIVYDASTKACQTSTSLSECLETGPPLQNRPWDILIRSRFRPILLCGYVGERILAIRIKSHREMP